MRSLIAAGLVVGVLSGSASACFIHIRDANGIPIAWMVNPSKVAGGGLPPGGGGGGGGGDPIGEGIPLNSLGFLGDSILKWRATSPAFPVGTDDDFFVGMEQAEARLCAGDLMIDFLELEGGFTMHVVGDASGHSFSTGAFTLSGSGIGNDGHDYFLNLTALAVTGIFDEPLTINGTSFSDPFVDILHPVLDPNMNFFDVSVSITQTSLRGGPTAQQNYPQISCGGYSACLEMETPTPGAIGLAGLALLAAARRRRP